MTQLSAQQRVTVGDVEMIAVPDLETESVAAERFPEVPVSEFAKYPNYITPDGRMMSAFGCFLIRSQGKVILVDTGVGPHRGGRLLRELKSAGVAPEDVDVVVNTHLHSDHVGTNITLEVKFRATFPNAQYLIPKDDWDYWFQPGLIPTAGEKKRPYLEVWVSPLKELGVLDLVEGERAITSEVTMMPTPGHTPGHMSLAIASQGQHGYILGDVASSPLQMQDTLLGSLFDIDKELARRTRERVLNQLERDGSVLGAGHTRIFGRLVRRGGQRYWQGI